MNTINEIKGNSLIRKIKRARLSLEQFFIQLSRIAIRILTLNLMYMWLLQSKFNLPKLSILDLMGIIMFLGYYRFRPDREIKKEELETSYKYLRTTFVASLLAIILSYIFFR